MSGLHVHCATCERAAAYRYGAAVLPSCGFGSRCTGVTLGRGHQHHLKCNTNANQQLVLCGVFAAPGSAWCRVVPQPFTSRPLVSFLPCAAELKPIMWATPFTKKRGEEDNEGEAPSGRK